ncbi:type I DNA topoisomerase [Lutibaculum baratangense]|uniref:DNA topoisomerase 1 n=1 Tax=Lutibaculum baratangense AMV1 TaxID=631454 RepID=V4TB05_9HYPH|nr:type I DNA topoisomerase [Lutibaculum baratangense]ESR23598.1 DNA topoisomerase I [Lutibaculum baratangense AMV1]
MDVVVVESPAKAKTINKYLGSNYQVLASYGHVRDLPSKDGSVRPDEDFAMDWEVDTQSKKRVDEIAKAVKSAERLILATDPDREGEAISWHVLELLRRKGALKDKPVSRVVFNAVTKDAVLDAMKKPREIDVPLVDAYLARRALDYLVGFTLSPVLWRKLPGARSAGRVQSVALRLVCDRESEIERFVAQEYWSIAATLGARGGEFQARLVNADGTKLDRLSVGNEAEAAAFKTSLEGAAYRVVSVEKKPVRRNPQPPFTTSTLQQDASRQLGFAPKRTMQVAQRLYEGVDIGGETMGLITYMRTDGVQIADEAIGAARDMVAGEYGGRYLPDSPRVYKTKAKNAQEAHEAIRPTDMTRHPARVRKMLDDDQARLYDLIWKRAVASQMASAELERTTIEIEARGADGRVLGLRATGSILVFDGFLVLYQEGSDDEETEEDRRLPPIEQGDKPGLKKVDADQHFTEPPPRYTEATLIKRLEELGIGRPSTYSATLGVLQDREYVRLDKRRLIPDPKGRLVTAFLESFFRRYVEYDFTADLEEKLDEISAGEIEWRDVLRDFWRDFIASTDEIKDLRVSEVLEALNEILGPSVFPAREDGGDPRACPSCADGRLSLKVGRYGAFVGCSNYPECRYTKQLGIDAEQSDPELAEGKLLGQDPETGKPVTLRTGRFGPFVQLGEAEEGTKPPRSSLPKGLAPADVDLDKALQLLSLPRVVGLHPETGEEIVAGLGRYGPFVRHQKTFANLESFEEIFSVGINRAVSLLAEKQERGGRRPTPQALKELGEHEGFAGPIVVRAGRYGPYVTDGKINATLPKDANPEEVTVEQAVELLNSKAGSKGKAKKASAKRAGSKTAASKGAGKTATKSTTKAAAKTSAKTGTKRAPAKSKSKSAAAASDDKA